MRPAILLILMLAVSACKTPPSPGADYVQVASSGDLVANDQGNFVLDLAVSPVTTMFAQEPGTQAAMIETRAFAVGFDQLFASGRPNAALLTQNDQGELVSVAIKLTSATYDTSTGTLEYIVAPLNIVSGENPGGAGQLVSLESLVGELGDCTLYIDDGACCITVNESQIGTCCDASREDTGGIVILVPYGPDD